MHPAVRPLLAASFMLFAFAPARCQITEVNNGTATPVPGIGHDYVHMLGETVSPANGSLSLRIQVPVPPGRQLTLPFAFAYNSNGAATPTPSGTGPISLQSTIQYLEMGGWTYSLPMLSQQQVSIGSAIQSPPDQPIYRGPSPDLCSASTGYVFQDAAGSRYSFPLVGFQHIKQQCTGLVDKTFASADFYTASLGSLGSLGSYLQPVTVYDLQNTAYYFNGDGCGPADMPTAELPSSIEDRNGNVLNFTSTCSFSTALSITDTLGRTLLSSSGFGGSGNTITVSGLAPYSLNWGTVSGSYAPAVTIHSSTTNCATAFGALGATTGVASLTLPNGQSYRFTYDPVYGLLNKITYPTGAYVMYTWGVNPQSEFGAFPDSNSMPQKCTYTYDTAAIAHRYVSFDGANIALQQDFSYSTTWNPNDFTSWTSKQTTVTTHDLVRGTTFHTIYTYIPIQAPAVPLMPSHFASQIPLEQSTVTKDTSGNTLRTVTKSWVDQYELQSAQTTLETGQSSKEVNTWGGSVIVEKDEYDFGQTSPTRKTLNTYGGGFSHPCKTVLYDTSGTNIVAETDYLFDGSTSVCGAWVAQTLATANNPTGHDEANYGAGSAIPRGNVTSVINKCFQSCPDSVTAYTYDETGQVLSMTDPNGNVTQFSFADDFDVVPPGNTDAYLTRITHPITNGVNHIESFSYAYADGQLTAVTDQNSQQTRYLYNDSLRRMTETDSPDGGQTLLSYTDTPGSLSLTTSRKLTATGPSITSVSHMDDLGHVTQTQLTSDPDGTDFTDSKYDGMGRLFTQSNPHRSSASPTDGVTTHVYDVLGRTTQVIPPDGSATANNITTVYSGNSVTVTDQAGKQRRSFTDGLGRLIEVDEPSSAAIAPGAGSVTIGGSETVSAGHTTCRPDPDTGLLVCTTTPGVADSGTVSITVNGFKASTTYGSGSSSATIASALASGLSVSSSPVTATANGSIVNLTSKATGPSSDYSLSASVSSATSFTAAASGATLTPSLFSTPAVTLYTYDQRDNLIQVVQSGSRQRSFVYNSLARLTSATNPESGAISYSYDPSGNLLAKTAPAPNQTGAATVTTNFAYDTLNRMTTKSYSDGVTPGVKYGYDAIAPAGCTPPALAIANGIGRRTSMCDAAGAESWSFDSMGRPIADQRSTNGISQATGYTYNLDGSVATMTYPSGRTITYTPNAAGHPVSAADAANSITYASSAVYGPQGALSSLTNGTSLVSTFYYNTRLQPCRISVKNTGTVPSSCTDSVDVGNVLDYTYNFSLGSANNGNVTGIVNNRDHTRSLSFTYDGLNRLASAQTQTTGVTIPNSNCWGLTFNYDIWGNLLQSLATGPTGCGEPIPLNVTATAQNQIAGYCYDAAGNLLDPGACPVAPNPHVYVYNAENQLTQTAGMSYVYDGDGQRVEKVTSGTPTKLYWYGMGSDPLDETDASGSTANAAFNEYIFFNGKRIARRDSSNNVNYYFADHLGTARVVTNSAGAILDDSDFYPFGGERPILSSSGNTYKFTAKERDSESGLDDFDVRYYSSSLGRFIRPDPAQWAGFEHKDDPQAWNGYMYGRDNPLLYTDPDGANYTVCDVNGKNCADLTDDQYKQFRQDNPNLRVTPSGTIYTINENGTETKTGSASYYNEKDVAAAQMLVTTGSTLSDPRTFALWYGGSAIGGLALYGAGAFEGGLTLLELGGEQVLTNQAAGAIIGWGTGQGAGVQATEQLTQNLTKEAVQQMIKKGLNEATVNALKNQYARAAAEGGAKMLNQQLLPRLALMEKIIQLWPK